MTRASHPFNFGIVIYRIVNVSRSYWVSYGTHYSFHQANYCRVCVCVRESAFQAHKYHFIFKWHIFHSSSTHSHLFLDGKQSVLFFFGYFISQKNKWSVCVVYSFFPRCEWLCRLVPMKWYSVWRLCETHREKECPLNVWFDIKKKIKKKKKKKMKNISSRLDKIHFCFCS